MSRREPGSRAGFSGEIRTLVSDTMGLSCLRDLGGKLLREKLDESGVEWRDLEQSHTFESHRVNRRRMEP